MDLRKSGSNMGGIGGEGMREGYKYSTIKWKSQKINKSLKSLLRTGFLTPPYIIDREMTNLKSRLSWTLLFHLFLL